MAFVNGSVKLKLYNDAQETEFPKDILLDVDRSFSDITVDESQVIRIVLAASGSQAINFNGVGAVEKVYIYSDSEDISVNFNALGAITYKTGVPGLMPLSISSLTIINLSSTTPTNVVVGLITG